ncbi:gamma-1-syntrophin-like [Biomphalaria glabrata]|uniref:Gamma-1-syntrophin-like n=1 Tax=Biomphalaria glabrata TaxID=6526 RepID=A0A9W2ZBD1_BIOGL|nr:gamma-1-syntrophin-like [Biomphalaria glabrata]KAI8737003.1 gamma-1-syntrophin [Biomphalaria glabrata]
MAATEEPEIIESLLKDAENKPVPIRLMLYPDALLIQKQEWISVQLDEEDEVFLNMVREVEIKREPGAGFGLCVKGGAEHRLPVLISRIIKNEAAERCGQLLVGDAILRVNGVNVESCTHDEVVSMLKEVKEDSVSLSVRHFRPASYFLNKGNETRDGPHFAKQESSQLASLPRLEKEWMTALTIPLLYARVSRYIYGTDKLREDSFDIVGVDGSKSGPMYFTEKTTMLTWYHKISAKTQSLLSQMIQMTNQLMVKEDHILLMCWTYERTSNDQNWRSWKEKFLALKAADIYLFDVPPMHSSDWSKCEMKFKVYECMLKLLKDNELPDGRQHCCSILTGARDAICLNIDSRTELLILEKAWYRSSNLAVKRLQSKTFGCTWQDHLSGLILDMDQGFSLYDHQTKSILWSYRFAQLKSSSDDGVSKLTLNFLSDNTKQLETHVISCSDLQTLIYCIHSFLSAKLSTVDPTFLGNH